MIYSAFPQSESTTTEAVQVLVDEVPNFPASISVSALKELVLGADPRVISTNEEFREILARAFTIGAIAFTPGQLGNVHRQYLVDSREQV